MARGTDRLAQIAVPVLAGAVALPLAAGFCGMALPAMGWFPALGARSLSGDPWLTFLATPGVMRAITLSLGTGLIATFLSFIASFTLIVALSSYAPVHRLRAIMGTRLRATILYDAQSRITLHDFQHSISLGS